MPKRKRDNSTFPQKVALRQEALRLLYASPVIMETHGGVGKLFDAVYAHVERGIVFEKDADKTAVLGKQRPSWAVYEADCVTALQEGVGGHLAVNFLDIDPYGECWPVVDAFFAELQHSKGAHATLDRYVADLARDFGDRSDLEYRARDLVDRMALALQASLLVRHALTGL